MKVFIVHAHPEPKSFCSALAVHARTALIENGHEVKISNLYEMKFDPVSDRRNFTRVKDPQYFKQQAEEMYATETASFSSEITAEMEKLFWCDALILQFPLWWFSLPAILKGWADRVLAMGATYGGGKWYDEGVFKGRRAMLSLTTGGSETIYSSIGLNGDINMILYPINHGILRFVGFDVLQPFVAWSPGRASQEQRELYLKKFSDRLANLQTADPIRYPALAEFDPKTFQRKAQW